MLTMYSAESSIRLNIHPKKRILEAGLGGSIVFFVGTFELQAYLWRCTM